MKLAKLPERSPVKLTVTLRPELAVRLREYADLYAETYGAREKPADLVPFMLDAFLDGDAGFRRASRAGGAKGAARPDPAAAAKTSHRGGRVG